MRRTFALVAVALASLAAAAIAALIRPVAPPHPPPTRAGALRMTTQLDRRYLSQMAQSEAYLQIDLSAAGDSALRRRVPVNAVLILDRSGSMTGAKIDRARDAARALVQALGPDDRLAIVEFSSEASVLFPSSPMGSDARARALQAIDLLEPMGGTHLSAAFDLAGPELLRGRAQGRTDKVFLASDGQANEGVCDRDGLLRLAQRDFGSATLSTFGIGEDYDEDLLSAFAAQSGGRARYIASPEVLPAAFRSELSRAESVVARNVRVRVEGRWGAAVGRVLGYDAEGGWVRLPDFAAGEERRLLVKLSVPPGRGLAEVARVELRFDDATSGDAAQALASVQATFTGDRFRLAEAPGEPALQYGRLAGIVDAAGPAASKEAKQKAFDAVRAPVAGW